MRRLSAAAITVLMALTAPAAALAQSAGDDQYRDPFAGDEAKPDADTDDSSGAGAPAPPPAPTASPTAATPSSVPADTLPYTGLPALAVAGLGAMLLAAGIGMRRSSR